MTSLLKDKEIVLGVTGGIAAYKVPELVRMLRKKQAKVSCILTENGARFVTPLTLQTLSGSKVYEGMFDPFVWDIEHISLAKKADVVVVVPATADVIARLAHGRADDLVCSVVLATEAPVLFCPAMNERMWLHPATQDNAERLVKFGYGMVKPEEGELACGVEGVGRLASLDVIVEAIEQAVRGK